MKTLDGYVSDKQILSIINNTPDLLTKLAYTNLYENLSDLFCGNIPTNVDFPNITLQEIIEENLKTHDYKKLQNKLYKEFPNIITGFNDYEGSDTAKSFYIQVNDLTLKDTAEFNKILSFYNYYVRAIDKQMFFIVIAPIYSEKATDCVWDNYGKGLFFVPKNMIDTILKTGIRCKSKVAENVNSRFYMFSTKSNVKSIDKTYLGRFIDKISKYKGIRKSDIGCISVDLNKFPNGKQIEWYKDNLMTEDEAVFTEQPIPAECLSQIELPNVLYEAKGDGIDVQWLNDDKPVMTKDGRPVIITKIDYDKNPNVVHGKVKMKEELFDYEWEDDGSCIKAIDQRGNPKQVQESDNLVKAC